MNKATIDELAKKRPNYGYIKGVGMVYNPSEDPDFIDYCRLMAEYKKLDELEVNHED